MREGAEGAVILSNIDFLYKKYIILAMTSMIFKVADKIPKELDLIQEEEGLGNRTAALTYLIKYYFLTQKSSMEHSIQILDKLLDRMDAADLPSLKEQLKDV